MEIITSFSKAEIEYLIYECVRKAINSKPLVPQMEPSDAMDFNGFLQLTGYRKPTGYKKVHEGSVPCFHRGKKLVFSRKEVLQWMSSQTIRRVSLSAQMESILSQNAMSRQ
jgi:predicted DNA-binding transcriptional regulator AlpA